MQMIAIMIESGFVSGFEPQLLAAAAAAAAVVVLEP